MVRHAFLQFKVGSYQLCQKINIPLNENFTSQYSDLAEHPVVLEMKKYPQHGKTNCYKHCLRVAYCNYCLCKMFHLDARSCGAGRYAP